MLYVGLNQHKKYSYCTAKRKEGEVVFKGKVPSAPEEIENFLKNFQGQEVLLALEAGPPIF